MVRTLFAVGVALLVLPATASAETIVNRGGTLTYSGTSAAEGLYLRSSGSTVRLARRTPVRARGCTRSPSGQAVCRNVKRVVIHGRGGGDSFNADELLLPAVISGGSGTDFLTAGGGPTELRGGPGDDAFAGSERTTISGGDGIDAADITARSPTALRVDLDARVDVEDVSARTRIVLERPAGSVTLIGDAAGNHLSGWLGDDTIVGGPGRDVLAGGGGTDTIDARDGEPDRVICGAGDTVLADPSDQVSDECAAAAELPPTPTTLVNRDGTLTYTGGSEPPRDGTTSLHIARSQTPGYAVRVSQSSVPMTVDGCDRTENGYECAGVAAVVIHGGPRSDELDVDVPATVDGGAGGDTLVLRAGGSASGGPGSDSLHVHKATVVSGGAGVDVASVRRTELTPLTVTLDDVADDGLAGERNTIGPDVENVITGPFYDRHDYSPDAGPARIAGSDAANSLVGSYGDDVIVGGKGFDELYGEDGDDRLDARDGEADRVVCGAGRDLARVDPVDVVSSSCERRIVRARTSRVNGL